MIPRLDVGYSAMIAAISGLLLLAANYYLFDNPVGLATLPTLLVVAVMGIIAWAVPTMKEWAGGIAGAVIVIVEAYLSSRTGDAIDTGTVTAAITYLVQLVFLIVIPRIRVVLARTGARRTGTIEVMRDAR